jgi:hypothetical protein
LRDFHSDDVTITLNGWIMDRSIILSRKPEQLPRSPSETGMMPRIYETGPIPSIGEETSDPQEPPQPPTLPEFDDGGSITGILRINQSEGEDAAKHADDTPTENSIRPAKAARR